MRALIAGDRSSVLKHHQVRNCSLFKPWWSWWGFATVYQPLASNFKLRKHYVSFRPQFCAPKVLRPGEDVLPCPPSYATVFMWTVNIGSHEDSKHRGTKWFMTAFQLNQEGVFLHPVPECCSLRSEDYLLKTWWHTAFWSVLKFGQFLKSCWSDNETAVKRAFHGIPMCLKNS